MSIKEFLQSYIREHRRYPSLDELRLRMAGEDLSPEDSEFLITAQEIPEDIFNNPFYHVQAILTYRDDITSVMNLYQGLYHVNTDPHGEW